MTESNYDTTDMSMVQSNITNQISSLIESNLTDQIGNLTVFVTNTNNNLDDFFLYINGILVLFMQAGFACLEAGSIRTKNVTNIMLKNFLDSLICIIAFWLIGYAVAFGNGNPYIGLQYFALVDLPQRKWSEWFFQYTFASTASTILSGAVAERSSFIAYLSYSCLMSGLIYPVAVHWAWGSQGWLKQLKFDDFAGGMLVHGLAGTACLVSTVILGPRKGRFEKHGMNDISGHSTALVGVGAIIIFVGFCGFNAGTMNHFSKENDGILAIVISRNTLMCAAAGALTVLAAGKIGAFDKNCWLFSHTINGGIAGLVSSCAGCDRFTPLESIITGIVAGIIYMSLHHVLLYFKIDDPLNSSPIHMGCGIWSILAVPLIADPGIINKPLEALQGLLVQILGGLSIFLWSFLVSLVLFGSLHYFKAFRSTAEEEELGMDISKHQEPAYNFRNRPHMKEEKIDLSQMPPNNGQISVLCSTSM